MRSFSLLCHGSNPRFLEGGSGGGGGGGGGGVGREGRGTRGGGGGRGGGTLKGRGVGGSRHLTLYTFSRMIESSSNR